MSKTFIEVLPHQEDFIFSDKVHTGLVGGFRSGKSQAGVIKTCKKKLEHPKYDVAYYLPTYGLIKDVAIPKFCEYLEKLNVPYQLNKSDYDFQTPYGRIIMRSMDNPDRIIGYEVVYSCADEMDVMSTAHAQEAFVKMVSRNSAKVDGVKNSLDFVSTPEGFKFLYDFFISNPHEDKLLIKANTKDNPFISEGYIETLKMSYTPNQLEAYLNGEFINLTAGTVYHHYDRALNYTDRSIQSNDTLHIGMDFNVTKMNAVVHVIDGKIKRAVDEITDAYDTADMIRLIENKYEGHKIVVYPDASGESRKTSGGSDIELLRRAKFTVIKPNKNPSVKDRVTTTNVALRNNKDEREYLVNYNNCPKLAEALERQSYKNGEPDKNSGFDHITEAAGYFIYNNTRQGVSVRSSSASSVRDRYL